MKNICLVLIFILTNCNLKNEPQFTEGTAKVPIGDGIISDTLKSCYCWRTQDSLGILIGNINFSGLQISISEKNALIQPNIFYYSDYDQFKGEFELKTKILKDVITLQIENLSDTIKISGNLNLEAEEIEYFEEPRFIKANGNFDCKIKK